MRRGAFSHHAIRELERPGAVPDYTGWIERVRASLRASGFDQSPQLEGTEEGKRRAVFSPVRK